MQMSLITKRETPQLFELLAVILHGHWQYLDCDAIVTDCEPSTIQGFETEIAKLSENERLLLAFDDTRAMFVRERNELRELCTMIDSVIARNVET